MKELNKTKYKKLFKNRVAKALDRAWLNLDFEITHYWKRATYFWTFIALDFAGYFALINSPTKLLNNERQIHLEFIIICLGYIFSLAWLLANLGSKKWQQNWEKHITELENQVTGPLYKTVLNNQSYSVSKINIKVNIVVLIIWIFIGLEFLNETYNIDFKDCDIFITATLIITIGLSLDMILAGGRSGFRYFQKKEIYFIDYQNKDNMDGKVKIRASLKTDSMEGWGWISKQLINENGFYKIENPNKKKIICYLRIIDNNFIKNYNLGSTNKIKKKDNTLIINEYYRNRLNVSQSNESYELKFKKCSSLKKFFSFDYLHPNPYVRQNSKLTILSIILGIISLGFAISSICLK